MQTSEERILNYTWLHIILLGKKGEMTKIVPLFWGIGSN